MWTPASIPTDWWIDAADANTIYDASVGGSLTADGGLVGRIEDKSGNGRHATQSTAAERPTRSGNTITFASKWLQFPPTVMGENRCIVGVWNSSATGGSNDAGFLIFNTAPIDNPELNFGMFTGGNNINLWWNSGYGIQSNQGAATQAIYAASFFNTTGSVTAIIHKNGLETVRGTRAGTWSTFIQTNCAIGYYPRINAYRNGTLCELIICNPSNRAIVEGYLAWKWNFKDSLPANHPYKFAAPRSLFKRSFVRQYKSGLPPKPRNYSVIRVKETDYGNLRVGLVGAWCPSLPNGGSGNTLPDVSGGGNHGTLTNMGPEDWVSGQYGRALDFDGVNDVVIASRTSEINSFRGVYASAWIFPRNNNVAKTVFKNGYTNNTGNNPFDGIQLVAWSDGNLYGSIRNTSVVDTDFSASAPYSANSWIHMAVWVGIDGIIRLYVNGKQTGTTQDASAIASSSLSFGAPPTIGARYETSLTLLTYFNGVIDDVRWGYSNTDSIFGLLASRPGIGLQPSPTRLIAKEKKTGLRRKILTGQT